MPSPKPKRRFMIETAQQCRCFTNAAMRDRHERRTRPCRDWRLIYLSGVMVGLTVGLLVLVFLWPR